MTVERTRQIFGDKFANLTDQEVLTFIGNMSIIGDEMLKMAISELTPKNNIVDTR